MCLRAGWETEFIWSGLSIHYVVNHVTGFGLSSSLQEAWCGAQQFILYAEQPSSTSEIYRKIIEYRKPHTGTTITWQQIGGDSVM